ncbi:hypothetical protein F4813DRAFT_399643 [Daldinia decipiens]|uniref:uncharacterized protein n=1 Tax=Daldinia decipiens TaxID=326647 RepID=UPI0020C51519|nr:uncharacterized protein F4813DRAFT_399643 [Daldinia decipiens]KAI1653805.1 hypothetical protein F4813DRAFT_399643 [Daldinia decipiens]
MHIPHITIQDWNDPSGPDGAAPVSSSRKIASGIRTFFRRLWSKRHLSKWMSRKPSSNGEKAVLKTDEIGELSGSSPGSAFDMPRLYLPDSGAHISLLDECRKSLRCSISLTSSEEDTKPAKETNTMDEREKTLRTLEQPREERATKIPDTRDAAWRHRRSFKLATDPRIDAQQFEEFQRYLEEEIAADLALCLGVWRNLTDQLLSQACAPIPPEYPSRASASGIASSTEEHLQFINTTTTRRSEIGARIGEGVEHQDGARKRRSRLSHINPAIKAPDPLVGYNMEFPEAKRLPRPKSSKPTGPKYLTVPSRRCRRERRASAPSLSHTVTDYIKPEIPPNSDMEPKIRRKSDGLGYKVKVHPYQ